MASAKFLVSGVVQGVFFRAGAREQARRLGLSGYAENLNDGNVEVTVSGAAAAIDALEKWLWIGSAAATVEQVRRLEAIENSETDGFTVR